MLSKPNGIESQIPEMRIALQNGKLIEFETHGFSMIPLLHNGGDRVVLSQPRFPLEVNDVALCKTDDGRYVLHRVVSVNNCGYTLRGDNCVTTEFCADDNDVIGVAVSFIRRGKLIEANSRKYRYYVRNRKVLLNLWRAYWRISDFFVKLLRH